MSDKQLPVFTTISPAEREAFGQSSLELLAAFNGWRVRPTMFMHTNDATSAVDNGVVGPPAFAARPLKWSPRALGGSTTYSNTTTNINNQTKKYFGMVVGQFQAGSSLNNGCQWDDNGSEKEWQSGGADYSYDESVEIIITSEFAIDGDVTDSGHIIGLGQPDSDILAAGGGLSANVNFFGFHMDPTTSKIKAVMGDGLGAAGTIQKEVADFITNTIYKLVLRWRHGGIIHAPGSNQGLHAESKFEWYLNDQLVLSVSPKNIANFGVLGTVGPRGVAPMIGAINTGGNNALRMAYFVYAYKGGF